jgi:hypothetical protein
VSENFESLVRPFQNGDNSPPRAYHEFNENGVPNIIMHIGRGGSGSVKTLSGSVSVSVSSYLKRYENEKSDG